MQIVVRYNIPNNLEAMVARFWDEGDWPGLQEILQGLDMEEWLIDD